MVPEGEVSSVPRKESRRTYLYILFTVSTTLWILCVRIVLKEAKLGIWQSACVCAPRSWSGVLITLTGSMVGFAGMSYFEVVASAMFFQFSLYACVRVAHHGLTFGELALVAFGATVLFMELVNLTKAKVRTSSSRSSKSNFDNMLQEALAQRIAKFHLGKWCWASCLHVSRWARVQC